jgi:hypothetical protein
MLKSIWKKSFTKLWGYAQMGGSAVLLSLGEINKVISDSTFKSYLDQLHVPTTVLTIIAVFGLITWLAHGREDD